VTTLNDILAAAQIGETTDWEFKSARGGFPGSFWETYSAMANSEGGVVVLGVSEKGDAVHLDGLTPKKVATYQKTLWDGLNNRGMVSANLLEIAAVEVVPLETSTLLAIRIPRAARAQRVGCGWRGAWTSRAARLPQRRSRASSRLPSRGCSGRPTASSGRSPLSSG